MVIGKPCAVRQLAPGDDGFDAEVERVHAAYKAEIRATYQANRVRFGYENRELIFVEDARSSKNK
eukprot:3783841-Prymnesium_polylepis.1